jgi:hypothetical protein
MTEAEAVVDWSAELRRGNAAVPPTQTRQRSRLIIMLERSVRSGLGKRAETSVVVVVRKNDWCQGRVVRWKKWKAEDDWESDGKVGEKTKDGMSQLLMRPDALSSWLSWPVLCAGHT